MIINELTLKELQPSQFYISSLKVDSIKEWFNPNDLSKFEPIPVKIIDDKITIMDGHSRAVVAILNKVEKVPLILENEDLNFDMYKICIKECIKRKINSSYDLVDKIISHKEYEEKWYKWCEELEESLNAKK